MERKTVTKEEMVLQRKVFKVRPVVVEMERTCQREMTRMDENVKIGL